MSYRTLSHAIGSLLHRRAVVDRAGRRACRSWNGLSTLVSKPHITKIFAVKPRSHFRRDEKAYMSFSATSSTVRDSQAKSSSTSASSSLHALRCTRRTKTVILGPLPYEVDEFALTNTLSNCGEIVHARIRRNARRGSSLGYGYVTFSSPQSVNRALELDGTIVGGQRVYIRALYNHLDEVHVRGLSWDVTEEELKNIFERCGTVTSTTIRSSKHGRLNTEVHGFVRFESPKSVRKAFEMNGVEFQGRRLVITRVMPRSQQIINEAVLGSDRATISIMVSNLPPQVDDDRLRTIFEGCGDIVLTRVQRHFATSDTRGTGNSLGFGFVQFASPGSAEKALRMHGHNVEGHAIRIERPLGLTFIPEVWPRPVHDEGAYSENMVWVGRLARGVGEGQLRHEFERFGEVIEIYIPRVRLSRSELRDYGFVTFASRKSVDEALEKSLKMAINGYAVNVRRAFAPQSRNPKRSDEKIVQTR